MSGTIHHIRRVIFFSVLFAAGCAHAQESFTGIVVDSVSLLAIPSVSIQIKGGTRGTQSDEKGYFAIEASRKDTLVFSMVGYHTLELPLDGYEAGMIRLTEKYTMLQAVTIDEYRQRDLYEGMFDEQNAQLKRKIPFYFSKAKKEKIKVEILKSENLRVQTYVDVVVNNPELKIGLMKKHSLSEQEYYNILRSFNETHYEVMYYLTRAELISLINTFFDSHASNR